MSFNELSTLFRLSESTPSNTPLNPFLNSSFSSTLSFPVLFENSVVSCPPCCAAVEEPAGMVSVDVFECEEEDELPPFDDWYQSIASRAAPTA